MMVGIFLLCRVGIGSKPILFTTPYLEEHFGASFDSGNGSYAWVSFTSFRYTDGR